MLSSKRSQKQKSFKEKRHRQVAALCYRFNDDTLEVLLIKTRGRGRWIVPKGWPMSRCKHSKAALIEAFEEAGVKGTVTSEPVGSFTYRKEKLDCEAKAYPVKVTCLKKRFPEKATRTRKWVSRERAARLVEEPSLKRLIRTFEPAAC